MLVALQQGSFTSIVVLMPLPLLLETPTAPLWRCVSISSGEWNLCVLFSTCS